MIFDNTIRRGFGSAVVKVVDETTRRVRYERVMFECAFPWPFDRRKEPNLILRALWPRQVADSIQTQPSKQRLVLLEPFRSNTDRLSTFRTSIALREIKQ